MAGRELSTETTRGRARKRRFDGRRSRVGKEVEHSSPEGALRHDPSVLPLVQIEPRLLAVRAVHLHAGRPLSDDRAPISRSRQIPGGQRKRLDAGEVLVAPVVDRNVGIERPETGGDPAHERLDPSGVSGRHYQVRVAVDDQPGDEVSLRVDQPVGVAIQSEHLAKRGSRAGSSARSSPRAAPAGRS